MDTKEKGRNEIDRLNEMSDHDLLVELVKQQKKSSSSNMFLAAIMGSVLVVLIILSAILIPETLTTFGKINKAMADLQTFTEGAQDELDRLDGLVTQTEESLSGLDTLAEKAGESLDGIDDLVGNANQIVVDNSEALDETIAKMNEIDFEKLNQAIDDLAKVVAPLASLFKR